MDTDGTDHRTLPPGLPPDADAVDTLTGRNLDYALAIALFGWRWYVREFPDGERFVLGGVHFDEAYPHCRRATDADIAHRNKAAWDIVPLHFGAIERIFAPATRDRLTRRVWIKLVSPFDPLQADPGPVTELSTLRDRILARQYAFRNHWWASVDHHGTTDTNPPWQAGDPDPAVALARAIVQYAIANGVWEDEL